MDNLINSTDYNTALNSVYPRKKPDNHPHPEIPKTPPHRSLTSPPCHKHPAAKVKWLTDFRLLPLVVGAFNIN